MENYKNQSNTTNASILQIQQETASANTPHYSEYIFFIIAGFVMIVIALTFYKKIDEMKKAQAGREVGKDLRWAQ